MSIVNRISSRLLTSVRNEATVTSMFLTSSANTMRVEEIRPQDMATVPAATEIDKGSMLFGDHQMVDDSG